MSKMKGASGVDHSGRRRTGEDRLNAIEGSMARRDEFLGRVMQANGDRERLADMMAEAIAMDRDARMLEPVSKDGRQFFSIERLAACHCMDAAREAYLRARGSNTLSDS